MTSPSDHGILSPPLKKEPTESKNFPIFASISIDFRFSGSRRRLDLLSKVTRKEEFITPQSLQHDPLISKSTHIYPVTFILEN